MIEIPADATLDQIASVASEEGQPLTRNQVSAVLAAYRNIMAGDPIGTIRKDPDTKAVAMRVDADGLHLWRVSAPDGSQYNDTQPTLPWPEL